MENEYVVLILFKIETSQTIIYEEDFLILKADTMFKAREIAQTYGKNETTVYKNGKHQDVYHTFVKVVDVNAVLDSEKLNKSRLLYSRHFADLAAYKKCETLMK